MHRMNKIWTFETREKKNLMISKIRATTNKFYLILHPAPLPVMLRSVKPWNQFDLAKGFKLLLTCWIISQQVNRPVRRKYSVRITPNWTWHYCASNWPPASSFPSFQPSESGYLQILPVIASVEEQSRVQHQLDNMFRNLRKSNHSRSHIVPPVFSCRKRGKDRQPCAWHFHKTLKMNQSGGGRNVDLWHALAVEYSSNFEVVQN